MKSLTGLSLAALIIGGSGLASCSFKRTPQDVVGSTTRYDSASKQLSLGCIQAAAGTCHFLVESGGKQRTLGVPAGHRTIVEDVDPAARVCAASRPMAASQCAWVPVQPPPAP